MQATATNGATITPDPPIRATALPIPVMEMPGLKGLTGGMAYTNPAKTFRFQVPPDWSSPAPDPAQPTRIITRAPMNAAMLTIEEGMPPDNWQRLMPPTIAGLLDGAYRAANPTRMLQSVALTGVSGANDVGAPTYRFTYTGTDAGVPVTVERFVTLTFAGALTLTVTAPTDAYAALRPTVEGIVGSVVPLRLDAPTPAALAPVGGGASATKTLSGLGLTLPADWLPVPPPVAPPGVEYAAQSGDGMARLRVVRKTLPEGTTLNDAAATTATELRASARDYSTESEGANTINGARAVRVIYRATVDGRMIVGQSVTLLKGTTGYTIAVEVPAAQYDAREDDTRALFDRIEGSVTLP